MLISVRLNKENEIVAYSFLGWPIRCQGCPVPSWVSSAILGVQCHPGCPVPSWVSSAILDTPLAPPLITASSIHRLLMFVNAMLITYKALNGLAPQYLSELLSHSSPSRPLLSQNSGHLINQNQLRAADPFPIWCPNSGTIYLTLFGRQTHSVSLNLD